MKLEKRKKIALDKIKPYWRNPRDITEEAVDAVVTSIERYGYQQPIVVDTDDVIVVGHTRHLALQKLGWKEAEVIVTSLPPEKAKEYRLVDNRTGEHTSWDQNALTLELREFDADLRDRFFPDLDLEIGQVTKAVTEDDISRATAKVTSVNPGDPVNAHTTKVKCPSCYHEFDVRTRSLPGLSYADMDELTHGSEE